MGEEEEEVEGKKKKKVETLLSAFWPVSRFLFLDFPCFFFLFRDSQTAVEMLMCHCRYFPSPPGKRKAFEMKKNGARQKKFLMPLLRRQTGGG